MNDFWTNISRYPRFFISSVVGSMLIILTPFRNLLKIKKFQFIVPIVILGLLIGLYSIIANMTAL
uniref:Uncharacterized protein ycf33 n=1 Tax=Fistulifera saprophila TaxID=880757 RepID=A0A8F1B844_9STRA|nr:hypothetical protein RF33 [Fistulifera saprophila]QWM93370.1 hypothetical protein RF33 [Fistulifera saprophila]